MKIGFTLLELIVVVIIISLISGVFVYVVYTNTNSKFVQYTREEMDEIKTALLEFYRDCDQFPSGLADLESLPDVTHFSGPASYRQSKWNGPYIQDKFGDDGYTRDAWNTAYVYSYTPGNNYCTLTSYGGDRASGGGDDITYTITAVEIEEEKEKNVQDELDVIQKALTDYLQATGTNPSSIDDLFEWEVLNLHMDESSWSGVSDEVVDNSGMGNHGTAAGGVTTTTGKVGRAGSFDAATWKYVNTSATSVNTTLTLEAWIYPTSYPGERATIIWGGSPEAYYLSLASDGSLQCYWYETTPAGYHSTGADTISLNTWSHTVATWSGSAVKLYVNGIEKNEVPVTGAGRAATINRIGAETSSRQFVGKIDEVRIYKVALSADEILRHYENPGYPRSYFDLHDYSYKYDEWGSEYKFRTATVGGITYKFFYSCGPDKEDDSGADDDILPRGLEWLKSSL